MIYLAQRGIEKSYKDFILFSNTDSMNYILFLSKLNFILTTILI